MYWVYYIIKIKKKNSMESLGFVIYGAEKYLKRKEKIIQLKTSY